MSDLPRTDFDYELYAASHEIDGFQDVIKKIRFCASKGCDNVLSFTDYVINYAKTRKDCVQAARITPEAWQAGITPEAWQAAFKQWLDPRVQIFCCKHFMELGKYMRHYNENASDIMRRRKE